jgi:hypothetical protein
MQWRENPPVEPGFYWAKNASASEPEVVRLDLVLGHLRVRAVGQTRFLLPTSFAAWAGPLPVPPPPEPHR